MNKKTLPLLVSILIFGIPLSGQVNNNPCSSTQYRQFDFWLGSWEVFTNDTLAGSSHIALAQDSCLIIETWKSTNGLFTGSSYNFYNGNSNTWHQSWVDNQGGNLLLNGNFINGQMILVSDPIKNNKGHDIRHRITWTPSKEGIVRQLWEMSEEENKWSVLFDGIYRRK